MINDNPKRSLSLSLGLIFAILLTMMVLLSMFPLNSVLFYVASLGSLLFVVMTVLILRDGRG